MTRKKILDADKVRKLIYAYDLSILNIEIDLPENMRDFNLTKQLLMKYEISLLERAGSIAYDACYFQFLKQNPQGTLDEFKSVLNPDAVKKVANDIMPKLQKKLHVKKLKEFHEKKFSKNSTKVDLDRQVK